MGLVAVEEDKKIILVQLHQREDMAEKELVDMKDLDNSHRQEEKVEELVYAGGAEGISRKELNILPY